MLKSLATIEQYKTYNRVNNNGAGRASRGLQVETNESDEEIQLYLNAASAQIRNYACRDFTKTKYTESSMSFDGSFFMTYEDIVSLNNVVNNKSVLTSQCEAMGNIVYSDYFIPGVIMVSYTAGSDEVPADIVQSCIYLASMMSRTKDRVGQSSITQGESTTNFITSDLPNDVKLILDDYRIWSGEGNKILSREDA